MSDIFVPARHRLIIPFLCPVYSKFAEPVGWLGFRLAVGLGLVVAGWPKIVAPLAQSGFVESLGMYPGWLWSPLLAAMQFFGGMLIAVGFLTRPVALANAAMLLITLWFHVANPYPEPFLTAEGLAYLSANPDLLTPSAQAALLGDGGMAFGARIQEKAIYASLFWAAGAALIAAFGGGYFSVDRHLAREF
ncbi:DoxX family protein [Mangrovicoccus ximenensis]|uniref:DoxX family protein n=1 Tax=Mangrovicoccus ximenensis TaxID=1911570 RepID=UPI000D334869|nr:DoxX family protein [Mangrovicoccus ximenensis]